MGESWIDGWWTGGRRSGRGGGELRPAATRPRPGSTVDQIATSLFRLVEVGAGDGGNGTLLRRGSHRLLLGL